jgi:hypothetical protein
MPRAKVPIAEFLEQSRRDWARGTLGVIRAHQHAGINIVPLLLASLQEAAKETGMKVRHHWRKRLALWLAHRLTSMKARYRVIRYGHGVPEAQAAKHHETSQASGGSEAPSGLLVTPSAAEIARATSERSDATRPDYGRSLVDRAKRVAAGRPGT